MLRSGMELQPLENTTSFTRRKGLIQGSGGVRLEIVLDQANVFRLWIDLIDQPAHDFGVILHRFVAWLPRYAASQPAAPPSRTNCGSLCVRTRNRSVLACLAQRGQEGGHPHATPLAS